MKERLIGIIDIGSNSVRLVIYQIDNTNNYTEIKNEKVSARLINYIQDDGNLKEEGIQILLSTLNQFNEILTSYPEIEVMGFATAVIRQASNKEAILNAMKLHIDCPFRLLSEYEEAYYGYVSVVNAIDLDDGFTIDIGGGSTEITLFKDRELIEYVSFPFGAVSLDRRFPCDQELTVAHLEKIHSFLIETFKKHPWLTHQNAPIIGIGGTARNVGRVHQATKKIEQPVMSYAEVNRVLMEIASIPVQDRGKIKGLSKKRKDIIIPGIMIILALMEEIQAPYFMPIDQSIREGILCDHFLRKNQ
ncbi:exopolyphosphatase [Cytobacillus gottheilii]|uniref:Ppx/GppA phosphatase family protein n=1 Tax=Cytobacillus gottheilii TaxID=859144 RepID=UPI001FE8F308|nr:exopolyphosphatase [Cytobacillus gottheilii]